MPEGGEGKAARSLPGCVPAATTSGSEPSASETIYVVTGSTGEYSDRSEWLVYAFHTEEAAQAYVDLLGVERQKLPQRSWDWNDDQKIELAMRAFDPRFSEDYTGTSWFVQAVELKDSTAERQPGPRDEQPIPTGET